MFCVMLARWIRHPERSEGSKNTAETDSSLHFVLLRMTIVDGLLVSQALSFPAPATKSLRSDWRVSGEMGIIGRIGIMGENYITYNTYFTYNTYSFFPSPHHLTLYPKTRIPPPRLSTSDLRTTVGEDCPYVPTCAAEPTVQSERNSRRSVVEIALHVRSVLSVIGMQ